MIWFKHLCNASQGETISQIEEEFGLEGYARFFKLMEVVASKSDADNYFAEYSEKKWCTFLRAKPKKLCSFLECLKDLGTINMEQTGNIIRIELPNLFKFKQKDLGRSRPSRNKDATNPPLDKEIDKEEDKEKEKGTKKPSAKASGYETEFEKVWSSELKVDNIGRNSRKESLARWISLRKDMEANDIIRAWRIYISTFDDESNVGGFRYPSNSGLDRLQELLETTKPSIEEAQADEATEARHKRLLGE